MLNDKPRKVKDYSHPTKWQLFWRTQRECWRRMVTPFLMYFFMGCILLSVHALTENVTVWVIVGVLCIAGGAFFNGHLCYNYGGMHYGHYVAGCLHRKNELFGIQSGGDHRPEKEYRLWKGFYIGLLIGLPVVIIGALAGRFYGTVGGAAASYALIMLTAWAIFPVIWLRLIPGLETLSLYWSILMVLLPVIVSGVFYMLGALADKRKRDKETARVAQMEEARKKAAEEVRIQTEEQRRKTLQSKKKR